MRLLTLLFCLLATGAAAQDYPTRPVRILVPYGPGGATDIIARIVAAKLTESLGQSFVVENRQGANGNIALEAAAKPRPTAIRCWSATSRPTPSTRRSTPGS